MRAEALFEAFGEIDERLVKDVQPYGLNQKAGLSRFFEEEEYVEETEDAGKVSIWSRIILAGAALIALAMFIIVFTMPQSRALLRSFWSHFTPANSAVTPISSHEGTNSERIEHVFDLLHKSKEEAMAMMGVTQDDLVVARMEKGPRMAGGIYEINREEYENKSLYLRLYYSDEQDITGYWIHFYYSEDTNGASYRPDYEKLEALVTERSSVHNEMGWRTTPDGQYVLLGLSGHQNLQTPLSDDTECIIFRLWEDPPSIDSPDQSGDKTEKPEYKLYSCDVYTKWQAVGAAITDRTVTSESIDYSLTPIRGIDKSAIKQEASIVFDGEEYSGTYQDTYCMDYGSQCLDAYIMPNGCCFYLDHDSGEFAGIEFMTEEQILEQSYGPKYSAPLSDSIEIARKYASEHMGMEDYSRYQTKGVAIRDPKTMEILTFLECVSFVRYISDIPTVDAISVWVNDHGEITRFIISNPHFADTLDEDEAVCLRQVSQDKLDAFLEDYLEQTLSPNVDKEGYSIRGSVTRYTKTPDGQFGMLVQASITRPDGTNTRETLVFTTHIAEDSQKIDAELPYRYVNDYRYYGEFDVVDVTEEQRNQLANLSETPDLGWYLDLMPPIKAKMTILGLLPQESPSLTLEQAQAICDKWKESGYSLRQAKEWIDDFDAIAGAPDYVDSAGDFTRRLYWLAPDQSEYLLVSTAGAIYVDRHTGEMYPLVELLQPDDSFMTEEEAIEFGVQYMKGLPNNHFTDWQQDPDHENWFEWDGRAGVWHLYTLYDDAGDQVHSEIVTDALTGAILVGTSGSRQDRESVHVVDPSPRKS
ncbi:MAG: hypothetical protein IJM90_08220 [Firmicutes bacterium]|nr:hypothetical protein [Bacillota bacterium]